MLFQGGGGLPINLDAYTRRVVLPALKKIGKPWYGWHAFRRGLASNLYALGAQDKIVQRILRHSRPHVTRDCYIKVLDHTVLQAMQKLEQHSNERIATCTSSGSNLPRLETVRENICSHSCA
jgi:integrase